MKQKGPYILIVGIALAIIVSVYFGSHPVTSPDTTIYGPDFASATPFRAFTLDQCSPADLTIPDEFACVFKLANATVDEANMLADKLIAVSTKLPEGTSEAIQKAQKAMGAFTDSVCDLDAVKIYGGTGMRLETEACRYYYSKQYLDILKGIERSTKQ